MQCKRCGHALDQNDKFCPNCGTSLSQGVPSAPEACPKCGHPVQAHDVFCTECGERLQSLATETKTTGDNALPERSKFQWRWAFLSIPIVIGVTLVLGIVTGVVLAIIGIDVEAPDTESRNQLTLLIVSVAIVVLGMFLGGLVAAYWSKGRTIREPAVGIALAVVVFNLLVGNSGGVLLGWVLPLLLGMSGAWLGERLQARKRLA